MMDLLCFVARHGPIWYLTSFFRPKRAQPVQQQGEQLEHGTVNNLHNQDRLGRTSRLTLDRHRVRHKHPV
jgi:hypothetical protein